MIRYRAVCKECGQASGAEDAKPAVQPWANQHIDKMHPGHPGVRIEVLEEEDPR